MSEEQRPPPSSRNTFARFVQVTPRWNDIDVFGHVNNAEFYAYFDTAVVTLLHEIGAISAQNHRATVVVAESSARFLREVLFTDHVEVGVRVVHLGTSSVRYAIGVFTNENDAAAVEGHFVHVFVDGETRRPTPIPDAVRTALGGMQQKADEK